MKVLIFVTLAVVAVSARSLWPASKTITVSLWAQMRFQATPQGNITFSLTDNNGKKYSNVGGGINQRWFNDGYYNYTLNSNLQLNQIRNVSFVWTSKYGGSKLYSPLVVLSAPRNTSVPLCRPWPAGGVDPGVEASFYKTPDCKAW